MSGGDSTRLVAVGRIIDGSGTAVRRAVFLQVKNGVITAIIPQKDFQIPENIPLDDLSHCTILPPLVDCSVFLMQSPSVDNSVRRVTDTGDPAAKRVTLERHIQYCYSHGVLNIADNDAWDLLPQLREELWQQSRMDIRSSTPFAKNSLLPKNTDCLRIPYSADIDFENTQDPLLSRVEMSRILVDKGKRKAVVLANGKEHVTEALDAGCDAIEQGYSMGEANLKRMAAENVLWIPGVVRAKNALDGAGSGGDVCCRFSTRYVAPGTAKPGAEAFWRKVLAMQLKQLTLAKELGVTTAVGTGAGSIGILHGESMVEEIKLFIKAGYSLEEAIRCASKNGTEFFGFNNPGTLTVGQRATFLVTRGTAKQLPRKLSYLESIYIDGRPSKAYSKHPGSR